MGQQHQAGSLKTVRVVVGAKGSRDGAEAPSYAAFDVNPGFMSMLARLTGVCKEHGLTETRNENYPAWGPGGIEEELRLQNGELVVLADGNFRFTDCPRDGGYIIQTEGVNAVELKTRFDSAADGEVIFMTDAEYVQDYYAADYA